MVTHGIRRCRRTHKFADNIKALVPECPILRDDRGGNCVTFVRDCFNLRQHLRSLARPAVGLLLVGSVVFAQGTSPIQERILGHRIEVPPINERINIAPITEGVGAFSATPTARSSRIFGVVINELGVIVPSAGFVIVRSLQSGKVIGQIQVDPLGQFNLPGIDPGLYAAELVDASGVIITSTPSFIVGIGEIVQLTPVVTENSLGGLASLVGSSSAGAVNSAVSAGVLAIETPAPISP
jgi:hypothetical protein